MPYFIPVKAFPAVLGLFFLTATLGAAPVLPSPDDPPALAGWFSELGTRREGSAAEARVFSALRTWFGPSGLEESGFQEMRGEHSFSRRLWFRVPGRTPGELIVVVPTDGANHRGLAWAVTWARRALENQPQVSLTFLFTGAERGAGPSAGLGSRAFLQDFYPTVPAAAVYLDADEGKTRLELTTESGLFPSPLWMVRGMTEAFYGHGLQPRFTGTAPSLFRLDLPERRNALSPWFERSIPALMVATGPPSLAVVQSLEEFVASFKDGVPDRWDRHYLVFDFGSWKFFWDQGTYLVVLLAVLALLVFGYALAGRGRRGSLRVLGTGFWQIPVLFAFLFLALYAGTLLAEVIQETRGLPEFWKTSPLLVWSFKAAIAISLYLLLFLPFRQSPLSRDPDFYGQAALLGLGIMVMVAAVFELSFSFYFLWALVWCAVLVVVPWSPVRLAALLAGPLWLLKAAWDVLGPQPDLALSHWALASPLAGNFALTVLFFPFLLQINAWHFSGKRHQNRDEGLRAAAQLGLFSLATVVLGLAVLRAEPAAARLEEAPPRVIPLKQTPREDLWTTQISRSAFLDRTVWLMVFRGTQGSEGPETVEFRLTSDQSLTVFDCSFPVILDADGHHARIIVGRQPPLPLEIRLTLPAKTKASLGVKVMFLGPPGLIAEDSLELEP